jgi:membrane protease YdiL (CAAX protease family)
MSEDTSQREELLIPQAEAPPAGDVEQPPRHGGLKLAAAFVLTVAVFAAGLAFGGEWREIAFSALEVLPFAVLALLAYLGRERRWVRLLTGLTLAGIILSAALATVLLTVVLELEALDESDAHPLLFRRALLKLALVSGGSGIAVLVAAAGFLPDVRRTLARIVPLDPRSFVHTVALVAVLGLALISFVPLLVLSAPPLLSLLAQGEDLTGGRGHAGMLLDEIYGLVWLVPATVLAVGYGVRRNLRGALARLGLQRPTWRQVAASLGLAVALAIGVAGLSWAIDWLWDALGWPKTDTKALDQLLAHFVSPLGAVVIGVVAGLGEELAVRGVLQPRLGIWLSNLFFTGLHALQYHWDALVVVFLVGLVLGVIRKKTSTTVSALVHGTYDFLLVMAMFVEIRWLSD